MCAAPGGRGTCGHTGRSGGHLARLIGPRTPRCMCVLSLRPSAAPPGLMCCAVGVPPLARGATNLRPLSGPSITATPIRSNDESETYLGSIEGRLVIEKRLMHFRDARGQDRPGWGGRVVARREGKRSGGKRAVGRIRPVGAAELCAAAKRRPTRAVPAKSTDQSKTYLGSYFTSCRCRSWMAVVGVVGGHLEHCCDIAGQFRGGGLTRSALDPVREAVGEPSAQPLAGHTRRPFQRPDGHTHRAGYERRDDVPHGGRRRLYFFTWAP